MACQQGHNQTARLLLMANSKTEARNTNHDTPLHIAAAMGRRKLTKIFMQHGAEPAIKNKQGETAMDIALRKDLIDIQELIANPPPLKASVSSQQEKQQQLRLRRLGAGVGSCGHLYSNALNNGSIQSQALTRHSKISHNNDVRVSSEDAISSELEHRLGQLAIRSNNTCRGACSSNAPSPLNGSTNHVLPSQYSLVHCNGKRLRNPKCRERCKTLSTAADLHLLMDKPSSSAAAAAAATGASVQRPKASAGKESPMVLGNGGRRVSAGSGGDLLIGFAGSTAAASGQLAPDAQAPAPKEWLQRPFTGSPADSSMAPVAREDEDVEGVGGKKRTSPTGSARSSIVSRRSCGGVSRRHHKTSLLVKRPNAVGTCVARILLLKPKHHTHQLLRRSLASSKASHDKDSSSGALQRGPQDMPLSGRRQERLDKMRQLSAAGSAMDLEQVARAPNGNRLQATKPLAALSDEMQLYAVPKKAKAKQQVAISHDSGTSRLNEQSETPSPEAPHHATSEAASQHLLRAGSDGPALTSDGCLSLTDSDAGDSYDERLSISGKRASKEEINHELEESKPCLCSVSGPFVELEAGHLEENGAQQVAGTASEAPTQGSIFHLGAVTRNVAKSASDTNGLVKREPFENEKEESSSMFVQVNSERKQEVKQSAGSKEEKQQGCNDKKPNKRGFWLKSRFSLGRTLTGSQNVKSSGAKGASKVGANNGHASKVEESSQLDASEEEDIEEEVSAPEQPIQITKLQSTVPKGKATTDEASGELAKPKSGLLSSGSAELIAAQKSLAAAAAAKVKRDRLARLIGSAEQQQQTTTVMSTTQEQSPVTSVPNLSHGVLTVKTADSFAWPSSAALNQPGSNQKYLLSGSSNGQSYRSGSNSVGMSDSSPSNNGADSDNSLHTTTGSLNTDNTSGDHQPANSVSSGSSPLGILSRILLNNKNYSNLVQQVHHQPNDKQGSSSSSNSGSPSTNQTGAAKKLEQLVSRSRQPIVVARSNELTETEDVSSRCATSSVGPPLPCKSALKPASTRWTQRPTTTSSNVSSEHMNGLPRVYSYTYLSSQQSDPHQQPQELSYKNLCGFHSGAHTQPSYFAHPSFRSPYSTSGIEPMKQHPLTDQQHHLSHHDLGALNPGCELNLPASAINYEYYLNGSPPTEMSLMSAPFRPGYHYCPPNGHHRQLLSQYAPHAHQDDTIYIPAYTLHEPQHGESDLSVPNTQRRRPKSSLDTILVSDRQSSASSLVYKQHRQFNTNYSPSSGPSQSYGSNSFDGHLAQRNQMQGLSSKIAELNLDSYITDVPANVSVTNGKLSSYYHGPSPTSGGCCTDSSADTISTLAKQSVSRGSSGHAAASFPYSTENSIYAANQASVRPADSDLTVLPMTDSSHQHQNQQHQTVFSKGVRPETCGESPENADGELPLKGSPSAGGSLEVTSNRLKSTTTSKPHKSLVQVNQSQVAKSNQSCSLEGQPLSPASPGSSYSGGGGGGGGAVTGVGKELQGEVEEDGKPIGGKDGSSHGMATEGVNNVNGSSRIQNKLLTTCVRAPHTKLIISSHDMQLGTSVKMGDDKLIKEPCNGLESPVKLAATCSGSAVI